MKSTNPKELIAEIQGARRKKVSWNTLSLRIPNDWAEALKEIAQGSMPDLMRGIVFEYLVAHGYDSDKLKESLWESSG